MPETPILDLPYPAGTDAPDVPADMEQLADRLEEILAPAGLDAGEGLLWNGTAWVPTNLATQAELDARAPAPTAEGQVFVGEGDGTPSWQTRAWKVEQDAATSMGTSPTIIDDINIGTTTRPALFAVSWRGMLTHAGGATQTVRLVTDGAVAIEQDQNAAIEGTFAGGVGNIFATQGSPADIVDMGGAGAVALAGRIAMGDPIWFMKPAGAVRFTIESYMSAGTGQVSLRRFYVVMLASF